LTLHLREEPNGTLTALTETGAFHVRRLHLNRAPLVIQRRTRRETALLREELARVKQERDVLRGAVAERGQELQQALARLDELSSP
jgi:hypothetical protein